MEVQGSLGRLIQGMSQQPAAVRLPGQVAYQLNTVPNVVEGTKSRPGTDHRKLILDSLHDNSHLHHYRRGDDVEEYFIITQPNALPEVFDKAGNKCSVTVTGDPATYVNSNKPSEKIRMLTVADFTFIVNTDKVVRARADKSATVGDTAIVYCAFGQYGTNYSIDIDGVRAAEYLTKSGGDAADVEDIRTESITRNLFTKLGEWTGISAYTISRDGTTIVIRKNNGTDITVGTEDGSKGKDLVAIRNRVASIDLLPPRAPVGYKIQVWPVGSKPESRYWMQAEPKGISGNLVAWKECLAPDVLIGFDRKTMPHVLIRDDIVGGIARFKLSQAEWVDRDAGDDLTNPFPSFLDQRLGGLFMTQNRLCLTNGEAVAMARTSRFFEFFRPTVLSALDTDPIDAFSDASEVYELTDAVSLDGDTVVFSRTAQFLLPGDKALTKENVVLRPTTTFECSANVPPVATGDAVMFAYDEGAYSGVREFFTDSTTDTKKAQPTTYHVNKLIEGVIRRMEASSNFNRLFVLATKNRHRIYVYDWLWQGAEKVQSAWHLWEFPETSKVAAVFYSSEMVYFIITRPDGKTYLESMELGDPLLEGKDDQYRVDRGHLVKFNYDGEKWVSTPLSYKPQVEHLDTVIGQGGWPAYVGGSFGFNYDALSNTLDTTFDLGDEANEVNVWVGETYPVQLEPTQVIVKDNRDKTSYLDVPTVGQLWINTDRAPPFVVDVSYVKTGKVRTVACINRIGGALDNLGGRVPPHEYSYRVPIRAKSTDVTFRIKVKSPHTFQLRDVEWEGAYNPRRRRV